MTLKEKNIFFSDLKDLDWVAYFDDYAKGARVYLTQDPLDTLDVAKIRYKRYVDLKWTFFNRSKKNRH